MKKAICVILSSLICLGLFASCSKKSEAAPLTEVYAELEKVPNMPSMEIMPDALIETLFGFDLTKFEEYVFAEASDPSVNADTIILIKLKDKADMTDVCDVLDSYLYSVKENTQSYSPVNYAKTQNSAVTIPADNYVYLIITTEYFDAAQIVNDMFTSKSEIQTAIHTEQ